VTEVPAAADAATKALEELVAAIDQCVRQLEDARARAQDLLVSRAAGSSWLAIVAAENCPLVVESVSAVLATLARAGSAFRREQAYALRSEQVSINRIAALFGVTRQRISALLRERAGDDEAAGQAGHSAGPTEPSSSSWRSPAGRPRG
jgi:hypothetical protein